MVENIIREANQMEIGSTRNRAFNASHHESNPAETMPVSERMLLSDTRESEDILGDPEKSVKYIKQAQEEGYNSHIPSPDDVVLRTEFAKEANSKRYIFGSQVILAFCVALVVVEAVWKYQGSNRLLQNDQLLVLNICVGSIILSSLFLVVSVFLMKLFKARALGKKWSFRRIRVIVLAAVDGTALFISCSCFLAGNVVAYAVGCGWFLGAVKILSFVRLTGFTALIANQFLLVLITMPVDLVFRILSVFKLAWVIDQADVKHVVHGIDLPWWIYALSFTVFWAPNQVLVLFSFLSGIGVINGSFCHSTSDISCYPHTDPNISCYQWEYQCDLDLATRALTIAGASLTVFLILLYISLVIATMYSLRKLPYMMYRVNHVELGLQLQSRLFGCVIYLLAVIILWAYHDTSCNSTVLLWTGFAPVEVAAAFIVIPGIGVRIPYTLTDEDIAILSWKRSVVWAESEVDEHMQKRPSVLDGPCFCFETSLKAWYFSFLVYDMLQVGSSPFNVETALSLYNLTDHALLWQDRFDAKCFMAWSENNRTIVISFRGTASKKNVVTDLKFWRSSHPPTRGRYWIGTRPMVHSGFLQFWYDSGLERRVMETLHSITANHSPTEDWKVIITGHSLGGAAAKLAAMDIVRYGQEQDNCFDVQVVTFGCPYVGNRAFSSEYSALCPNSWDIFHPNDAVAVTGKFFFLYKRGGNVALISTFGDVVVQPTHLERRTSNLFRRKSVKEHLLSTYGKSFSSVFSKERKVQMLTGHYTSPSFSKLFEKAYIKRLMSELSEYFRKEDALDMNV